LYLIIHNHIYDMCGVSLIPLDGKCSEKNKRYVGC
jgi:hypothetical protein